MTIVAEDVLTPSYAHLARLTSGFGLHEHADHDVPRREHGHCVDDVARAIVVTIREPLQTPALAELTETYLTFLESAVAPDGRVHNRMSPDGHWTDEASIGDWWGRAIAGLGFTMAHAHEPFQRTRAAYAFLRAAARRSPDVRASAFAAIGAAEVVRWNPKADAARTLLASALAAIPLTPHGPWTWPEARLRYANGALCEALIAGGDVLGQPQLVARGLELLSFLMEIETAPRGHLSVTGSAGRDPGEPGPLWDQQAIEPAALASACARAAEVDGAGEWLDGVERAWAWFAGANDNDIRMYDPVSGAGYDGLNPAGRNENRGAESTIAALNTLQLAGSSRLVRLT
jgi:hypothetical protein